MLAVGFLPSLTHHVKSRMTPTRKRHCHFFLLHSRRHLAAESPFAVDSGGVQNMSCRSPNKLSTVPAHHFLGKWSFLWVFSFSIHRGILVQTIVAGLEHRMQWPESTQHPPLSSSMSRSRENSITMGGLRRDIFGGNSPENRSSNILPYFFPLMLHIGIYLILKVKFKNT